MFNISLKGRYTRKQFWIYLLLINLLLVAISIPSMTIIGKSHDHFMQLMIAKKITANQGTIHHQDIDRMKTNVENDNRISLKTKANLENTLDEMDKMSDAELTNLTTQELSSHEKVFMGIYLIIVLLLSYVAFTIYVKRGHDLNLSGWVTFIGMCIPFVNLILIIYLGFFKGNPLPNQYGPSSLSTSSTQKK